MLTLSQIIQYANSNNIDDNTDIFSILSQMQLEYKQKPVEKTSPYIPTASEVEYSVQDVLDLFSN